MRKCLAVFLSFLICLGLNAQQLSNPYASIGKPMPQMATLSNGVYDEFLHKDSIALINGDVVLRRTGELLFSVEIDSAVLAGLYQKQQESFRFLSVDPLQKNFPWWSPYHFAGNSPIENIDLDGLETYNYRLAINSKTGHAQLQKIGEEHGSICDCAFNIYVEYKGKNYFVGITQFTGESLRLIDEVYNLHGKSEADLDKYFLDKHTGEEWDAIHREENARKDEEFQQMYFALKYAQSRMQDKGKPSKASKGNQTAANNGVTLKNSNPQSGPGFVSYAVNIQNGKVNINGRAVTNGTFDYVITNEGKLLIGSGHYNLSDGALSVRAAGQIKLYKGQITSMSNNSGHYMPTVMEGEAAIKELSKLGVNTSGANVKLYNKDGVVEKSFKVE